MKKIPINIMLYAAMFLMAGVLAISDSRHSSQSVMAKPMPVRFIGEYSLNGGDWQKLSAETDLSAYDGEVLLRGRFQDPDLPEGSDMRFYLNHIGIEIYRDGEMLYESSLEKFPGMCGSAWAVWEIPAVTLEDVFEIRLFNPHSFGNKNAYNQLLNSIYMGGDVLMKNYLEHQSMPYKAIGVFILLGSVALIGTAIGYRLLHLPGNSLLLKSGIMSLMMGVYIYFDTKDISLWSGQLAFNTNIRRIAMMLAAWLLGAGVAELLHGKQRKMADITVYVLMFTDFVLMAVSLAGVTGIYDTGSCWAAVQGTGSLLLLFLIISELKTRDRNRDLMQPSAIVLLIILLLELVNACAGWWQDGILVKSVFAVLFTFQIIRGAWTVARNQQASIRAGELEEELKNSRVVLSMSQIRTHFVFNILNAISGMCAYDPQKADETLVIFSRYLRSNINMMEEDEPEAFPKALEYLEQYIALEQVRFGEKIRFTKNIETEDFKIPPLILQPLVENAIRHGLLHKKQGGTVSLHTWTENGNSMIEISDDGAGFDTTRAPEKESVGMKNVRFRLKYMAGGTMEIKSTPGQGTCVTLMIPGKQKIQETK